MSATTPGPKHSTRMPLFPVALALTLLLLAVFRVIDAPLQTPAAPHGIFSYELAWTTAASRAILDSWDPAARLMAAFGLGIDYLFMLCYALTVGLACLWAGRQGRWRGYASLALVLAFGQGLAALLDASENAALMRMLLMGAADPWPAVAAWCATIKFGLVLAGLAFVLSGVVLRFVVPQRRAAAR